MKEALEVIGIIVAVEGLFKAVEFFLNKLFAGHDKSKKIDSNAENLSEYIEKTDKKLQELDEKMCDAHGYAVDSLKDLEKSITNTLNQHREEYMTEIKNVNKRLDGVDDSITEMKAVYQQTVAVVDIKIDALEKAQNRHNNLITRMYEVESNQKLQTEQIKVANHRIDDLERKAQ